MSNLWRRQGLDGSFTGLTASEILERAGWARSVGGVSPYLGLFARGGLRRADADAAIAAVEIHELPAARGCTYILPASDFALGLAVGSNSEMRVAYKLGVTDDEVAVLRKAIAKALTKGPLDPEQLKAATGSASRNLGDEGKKKGMITTMPLALGLMQAAGEIRRISVEGRLDRQRYKYALWNCNPKIDKPFEQLARRFAAWVGEPIPEAFRKFSGLGVKAANEALAAITPSTEDTTPPPKQPQYALLSTLDSLFLNGRETLNDVNHVIVDRGSIVGEWEFEQSSGVIVWTSTVKPDRALRETIAKTQAFIREDVGDARSFSLDSPQSRAPRIEQLRKAAAK